MLSAYPRAAGFKAILPMMTVALMTKAKAKSSTEIIGYLRSRLRWNFRYSKATGNMAMLTRNTMENLVENQ